MLFKEAETFYGTLNNLVGEFNTIDENVSVQNEKIKKLIENFSSDFSTRISDQKGFTKIQGIEDCLAEVQAVLKGFFTNFKEKTLINQQQQKLRDEFSDSFIIFIYGKVKAGKSSLGNYIAKGRNAKFFRFDKGGASEYIPQLEEMPDGFEVKATEATSCIQGMRIDGLTWIDSPGLHSMTEENGKLAELYVEAADLVLYTMASDSPGRATDLNELKLLSREKKKNIYVVITKSDTTEEDEKDGEIVKVILPKSEEKRKEQNEWVASEINKHLGESQSSILSEVFSISKLIAEKAQNDGDEKLWASSNMPYFYKVLSKIVADAILIKKDVPMKRLRAFIDSVIGENINNEKKQPTINGLIEVLNGQGIAVRKAIEDLNQRGKALSGWIESHIDPALESIFRDVAINSVDKPILIEEKIRSIANDGIREFIAPLLSNFNQSLVNRFSIDISADDLKVNDTFKDVKIKTNHAGKGSALGSIVGGIIGSVFFGPVGAAVGATIGSGIGGVAGGAIESEESEKIRVGDNSFDVLIKLKKQCISDSRKRVDKLVIDIREGYFRPIEQLTAHFQSAAVDLKSDLEKVVNLTVS